MGQRRFGVFASSGTRPKAAFITFDEQNLAVTNVPKERVNKDTGRSCVNYRMLLKVRQDARPCRKLLVWWLNGSQVLLITGGEAHREQRRSGRRGQDTPGKLTVGSQLGVPSFEERAKVRRQTVLRLGQIRQRAEVPGWLN